MYGQLVMTCFKYQLYLYGSRSHHIFDCFPLGGNRASTMSPQTAPTPTTGSPPPTLAAQPSPIWKRALVWLN
jgi:hypothetical protein